MVSLLFSILFLLHFVFCFYFCLVVNKLQINLIPAVVIRSQSAELSRTVTALCEKWARYKVTPYQLQGVDP
jgi:hypothetical protein